MCRLLGVNAGRTPVNASFWLLEAPDSLAVQSHRDVDGSGLGWFDADGTARLDKSPEPAFRDADFQHEARTASSGTFVAHVRMATTGGRSTANTHPFLMAGRLMAQNGGLGDLPALEARLGGYLDLVRGDTDSERFFALVTKEIDEHAGDVGAGIAAAARWVAETLPMYSLNCIVIEDGSLWALRYPDQRALHVLAASRVRASTSLAGIDVQEAPQVVVSSERLDDDPGWRMLDPGELLHVGPDLSVTSTLAVPDPPRHLQLPGGHDPNDDR